MDQGRLISSPWAEGLYSFRRIGPATGSAYYFFIVIVIRHETTAAAPWALLLLVRTLFNDAITVAVWTGFHVCLPVDTSQSPIRQPYVVHRASIANLTKRPATDTRRHGPAKSRPRLRQYVRLSDGQSVCGRLELQWAEHADDAALPSASAILDVVQAVTMQGIRKDLHPERPQTSCDTMLTAPHCR